MKIKGGKYSGQFGFGFAFTNYFMSYRALIIDIGIWYVEIVFQDYPQEGEKWPASKEYFETKTFNTKEK